MSVISADLLKHLEMLDRFFQRNVPLLECAVGERNFEDFEAYYVTLDELAKGYSRFSEADQQALKAWLSGVATCYGENILLRIVLLSLSMQFEEKQKAFEQLVEIALQAALHHRDLHFLYWQLMRQCFLQPDLFTLENRLSLYQIHARLFHQISGLLNLKLKPRKPQDDVQEDLIVVLVSQFLSVYHAPTAAALDYCYNLAQHFGKRVFLINTSEYPRRVLFPFYPYFVGSFLAEYSDNSLLGYEEMQIPFFQNPAIMPDVGIMGQIVESIHRLNPAFVFALGGSCVTADLCAQYMPVLHLWFGAETPIAMKGPYVVVGKQGDPHQNVINRLQIPESEIVRIHNHIKLPKVAPETLLREDLGLPQEAFVVAVVGNRLPDEMTDAFLEGLETLFQTEPRLYLAVMGIFPDYAARIAYYPTLQARSALVGYQKNLPAAYELCNLYLNPPRAGGGTSAGVALSKGLPVVCLTEGDVSDIVGRDRLFPDWEVISAYMTRCVNDASYYAAEREVAKQAFARVSDCVKPIQQILDFMSLRNA